MVLSKGLSFLLVWSSALPLLKYIQEAFLQQKAASTVITNPLRVLELGSGTGILGLCVAAFGCEVVLTDPAIDVNFSDDVSSNTIDHLRANLELNRNVVGKR